MEILRLEGIGKQIAGREILRDVSFSVAAGEIFGIVGPDGAGKSALMKTLAGVWRPSAGRLVYQGDSFEYLPETRKMDFGYMAFHEGLYPDFTALENLQYAARLYDLQPADSLRRAEALLERTGLGSFRDLPVKSFSGGMKQKLSLCCAMLHRPKILLLDEPSTGVDPLSRRLFWNLLSELPEEEGATILLTTPYFEEISRCNRVILLSQGRVILGGDPQRMQEKSGWQAIDFWPDRLVPAIERLEEQPQVESYRIKGHAVHLVYPKNFSPQEKIFPSLEASGVHLERYQASRVEVEDLFYLHLKSVALNSEEPNLDQENWRVPEGPNGREVVVRAVGLQKSFGKVQAVKEAGFTIRRGEIFGIIGSNGAGKTTVLKMLCGLLFPDRGTVRILDQDPMELRDSGTVGYMSQDFSLYSDLTVEENIQFYGGVFGMEAAELRAKTASTLKLTGLQPVAGRLVKGLPAGWKQRLALGCSLIHDPKVLLLDEPTSGVDPVTRRYLWQWISLLAETGRTVVVTTHYMAEAEQCHQILLMHQGTVLDCGSPEEICSTQTKPRALFEVECEPLIPGLKILKQVPWIHSAIPFGNQLHVMTPKQGNCLRDIRALLGEQGVKLTYASPIPYSIEDVFVEELSKN